MAMTLQDTFESKAVATSEASIGGRRVFAPIAFLRRGGEAAWHAYEVGRTRLVWGRRLHSLGKRCILNRSLLVDHAKTVAIGSRVMILSGFIFADLYPEETHSPKIVIGDGTRIQFRFQCNAARSVVIGKNVLIASNVLITDSDHIVEPGGLPVTRNPRFVTRPVRIEDNCWIGQNAVILKGVTVGHDSIIGANSVVTRSVPPFSVAAGNPARVVKTLMRPSPTSDGPGR